MHWEKGQYRLIEWLVILPYSSNLKSRGRNIGGARLSFFSSFIVGVAAKLYKRGLAKNLVLCGESTFVKDQRVTTMLMYDALVRLGVSPRHIHIVEGNNLNNTPLQAKALAKFQRARGLRQTEFTVLMWSFHRTRAEMHFKAHGFKASTESAEILLRSLEPKFRFDRLIRVLPPFEREPKLAAITKFDGRGYFLRLLTFFRGASVTDIEKVGLIDGDFLLRLTDTTGPKRLRESAKVSN